MTTMNTDQIRAALLQILGEIAPEADLGTVKPNVSLRDQLDIDSMDFQHFLVGVDEALGVDIPERDYSKLTTLDACAAYLEAKLGRSTTVRRAT